MTMRTLVAVPIYNEADTIERVLPEVRRHADHLVAIDDGSTDGSGEVLRSLRTELGIDVVTHQRNLGYGRAMIDAFAYAAEHEFDWVITIDCDEQHEPTSIPAFVRAAEADDADVISGSRYAHEPAPGDPRAVPPADRRAINRALTGELNTLLADRIGGPITDAFCGFKAYRVEAVGRLDLTEAGYAFPMQFWVEAAAAKLRVRELPVRLIYTDAHRTFGGGLDDPQKRLAHYRRVMCRALSRTGIDHDGRCGDARSPASEPAPADAGVR